MITIKLTDIIISHVPCHESFSQLSILFSSVRVLCVLVVTVLKYSENTLKHTGTVQRFLDSFTRVYLLGNLLVAMKKVDCVKMTPRQSVALHQIELILTTMTRWQRIPEEDRFVTRSLVVIVLYCIRKAYVTVYLFEHTKSAVNNLTLTVLADFNTQFIAC